MTPETGVIGSILIDAAVIPIVTAKLNENDFISERAKAIYKAALALHTRTCRLTQSP